MSYLGELRKIVGHRELLSAGATVIVIKDNKILLNLRSDTKTWGIPGGALELGESLEETACRELYEETGLRADSVELLTVLSGKDFYFEYPNGDKLYSVVALFLAEDISGDLKITDGESLMLQYFSPHNLPTLEHRAETIIRYRWNTVIICSADIKTASLGMSFFLVYIPASLWYNRYIKESSKRGDFSWIKTARFIAVIRSCSKRNSYLLWVARNLFLSPLPPPKHGKYWEAFPTR